MGIYFREQYNLRMTETYNIKTDTFEGPLDLLLTLIEKRKFFINDISLVDVTDDYIAYLNEKKEFPISQTADFILVASTLLLIKSKSLMPSLSLTEEEESSIEDLEHRLGLYKKFKALSRNIQEQFGKQILFSKLPTRTREPFFSPDDSITSKTLFQSMQNILHNLPKKEDIPKVIVQKIVSLEEMVDKLTERMKNSLTTSFKDFSGIGKEKKVHVIVSFLAMLELVKQGIISVSQENMFSDITIESDKA